MRGACKPDSVPPEGWRPFISAPRRHGPEAANPDRRAKRPDTRSLFGIAPGGACHARDVAAPPGGLLPHRFTPLPPAGRGRSVLCGAVRRPTDGPAARALPRHRRFVESGLSSGVAPRGRPAPRDGRAIARRAAGQAPPRASRPASARPAPRSGPCRPHPMPRWPRGGTASARRIAGSRAECRP